MTAVQYYMGNTDPVQELVNGFKVKVRDADGVREVEFNNSHFRWKLYGKMVDSLTETIIVPHARQTGFTTGMAAYYVAMAAAKRVGEGVTFVYIAPNTKMCEDFMVRVQDFVEQIPLETWHGLYNAEPQDNVRDYTPVFNMKQVRFWNGSKIVTASTMQTLNSVTVGDDKIAHILIEEGDLLCNMTLDEVCSFCENLLSRRGVLTRSLVVSGSPIGPKSKVLAMRKWEVTISLTYSRWQRFMAWVKSKKLPFAKVEKMYPSMVLTWRDCPWYFGTAGLWFEQDGFKLFAEEGKPFDYGLFMDLCESGWQPHSQRIEDYRKAWPKDEDNFYQLAAGVWFDEWLDQV